MSAIDDFFCFNDGRGRCTRHGGVFAGQDACQTTKVLEDVSKERIRQFRRYGTNESLEDGTGPEEQWLYPIANDSAEQTEYRLRREYELHEHLNGAPTWMHLLREEFAEAMQESDPAKLREELVQVAAVAVSWVEKIDMRGFPRCPRCQGSGEAYGADRDDPNVPEPCLSCRGSGVA